MLAEIHGKLAPESTQEFERLEDLLTDYVFGALKYLDGRYLGAVLDHAFPDQDRSQVDLEAAAFRFWPQLPGGTEPDVMLTIGRDLVIVEAKLHSGFGTGEEELDNQLIREWRHGRQWAMPRRLRGPRVLAVTADYSEPPEVATASRFIRAEFGVEDTVRWISWQQIARIIEDTGPDAPTHERLIIEDLLTVMERRGVRRVFTGFEQEDYWVVAAATRIAADRIFPAVATFAEELFEQCEPNGLVRGTTEKKIVTNLSASLNSPHLWGVTYINIPLWVPPPDWPRRRKHAHAMLFVQFPLTEPVLRVGYRLSVNRHRKKIWHSLAPDIVTGLNAAHGHEVGFMKYPDLGTFARRVAATEVTDTWLNGGIEQADTFVVQRTLPLDDLTQTAIVRDMLIEDVALLNDHLPQLVAEAEHA